MKTAIITKILVRVSFENFQAFLGFSETSFLDSDIEDNKDSLRGLSNDNNNNQKSQFSGSKKNSRFFWQYNVQAKGPKGQRLVIKTQAEDPHHLNEVTDPVFSPNCSVRGIKVSKNSFYLFLEKKKVW